ncbi:MAG: hypothetical protein K0M69_00485 [Youngiibacter sp.]|nr:hypothetical protein [Youngiibacter sp.]
MEIEMTKEKSKAEPSALKGTSVLMMLTSLLALYASIAGIFTEGIYRELIPTKAITEYLILGSVVQDIITVPVSIALFISSFIYIKGKDRRVLTAMAGLVSYIFYSYALFSIQGQYTRLYLIYLVIFGASAYGLMFIVPRLIHMSSLTEVPRGLRRGIAGFLLLILAVLVPVWIMRMQPDIANRAPGELYGVFVLDLAVVFPAFGIIAFNLIRNNAAIDLLTGAALVKVFTLCLSVGLGEFIKPSFGFPQDMAMTVIFITLTIVSAIFSILIFRKLKAD